MPKFPKKASVHIWGVDKFMENCAIMPPTRKFGFKNRNFRRSSLSKEVKKPFLDWVTKGAA
jgi:hypothetical protein